MEMHVPTFFLVSARTRVTLSRVALHKTPTSISVTVGVLVTACHKMAVLSSPLVLLQSVPPVTRAFTGLTIVSSALYAYLCWKGWETEAAHYMTIVPGSAFYAPWTLLTSAFVEPNIFEVSVTGMSPAVKLLFTQTLAVYRLNNFCSPVSQIPGTLMGKR